MINYTSSSVLESDSTIESLRLQTLLFIPSLPNLESRVFGYTDYVHIHKYQRNKLDSIMC